MKKQQAQPRAAFGEAEAAEEQAELIGYKTLDSLIDQAMVSLKDASGLVGELIAAESGEPTASFQEEAAETTIETAKLGAVLAFCGNASGAIFGITDKIRQMLSQTMPGAALAMTAPAYANPSFAERAAVEHPAVAYLTRIAKALDAMNLPKGPSMARVAETRAKIDSMIQLAQTQPRVAVGARNSAKDLERIQTMHDHSVALGAACSPKAAAAAPPTAEPRAACDCAAGSTTKEFDMNKVERVRALIACPATPWTDDDQAYLETQSDERLLALESHRNSALKAAEEKAAVEAEIVKLKAAAEAPTELKPATEEEYLAVAPDSIKQIVSKHKAAEAARKTDLVSILKAAQSEFTEDELKAQTVDDLERLARVAKASAPAIDYTLRGAPRAAEQSDAVPPPPSVDARILAARK